MKYAWLVVVLAAACTAPSPGEQRTETSHVGLFDYPEHRANLADVLFVVDHSAAMIPHAAAFAALPQAFGAQMDPAVDLHVSVTSADPADGGAIGPIVVDTGLAYDTRTVSYRSGTLGDAVAAQLGDATDRGPAEPFVAARLALAAHPEISRGSSLAIVAIVGDDDHSTTLSADVAALAATLADPGDLFIVTIDPLGHAPHLDALPDLLPGRVTQASIDDPGDVFTALRLGRTTLEGWCLPKAAHDCSAVRVATDIDGVVHRSLLPACTGTGADTGPCWSHAQRNECGDPAYDSPFVNNDPGRKRGLELECLLDDD